MQPPWFPEEQHSDDNDQEDTQHRLAIKSSGKTSILEKKTIETADKAVPMTEKGAREGSETEMSLSPIETPREVSTALASPELAPVEHKPVEVSSEKTDTHSLALPEVAPVEHKPLEPLHIPTHTALSRGRAILFTAFLLVLVWNATNMGGAQFIGTQGWAYVLGGSTNTSNPNLLSSIAKRLHSKPTPGTSPGQQLTPQEYIDLIVQNMTLDQKLGQMMIVQFFGPSYSPDLSTMVTQYNVGAALIFGINNNIVDKSQLQSLIQQMQRNSAIPLAVAIDQEGGTVDRLVHLDGPRPSESEIGATNDPNKARVQGIQDANDLASYGINLNLAPVVDVNNVYNPQLYLRTYGNNAALVTKMAEAYLQGLQQSGKVMGTLKHFPGLGDVAADPHNSVPYLNRSESNLEAIDWAPYRTLIAQGNVDAVMVTHEIVSAIDNSKPSSLSDKIVTGILRNKLGFHGVIMTDSLTMEGILAYYTEAQAAVLAVKAGCDLLMGASTARDVATMINGLKQALSSGELTQQRIDDSVRRILMLKYQMGLLQIPTN